MPSKVLKHNKSMRERRVMCCGCLESRENKQLPDEIFSEKLKRAALPG
jgi:hypothetical protein